MTLIKDCFDDPTVNIAVSPRELSLILSAMNELQNEIRRGNLVLKEDTLERWDNVLDYVQDQALAHGHAVSFR